MAASASTGCRGALLGPSSLGQGSGRARHNLRYFVEYREEYIFCTFADPVVAGCNQWASSKIDRAMKRTGEHKGPNRFRIRKP